MRRLRTGGFALLEVTAAFFVLLAGAAALHTGVRVVSAAWHRICLRHEALLVLESAQFYAAAELAEGRLPERYEAHGEQAYISCYPQRSLPDSGGLSLLRCRFSTARPGVPGNTAFTGLYAAAFPPGSKAGR